MKVKEIFCRDENIFSIENIFDFFFFFFDCPRKLHFITHKIFDSNCSFHRKDSKYYEIDCLQNFLLHFMFLLTTKFVQNSHI